MFRFATTTTSSKRVVGLTSLAAAAAALCSTSLPSSQAEAESPNVAISKKDFTPLTVSSNVVVGKNVHKVTLDFPNSTDTLGMTTAGMLMVQGEKRDGSGVVARPYTPVSRNDTVGKLELIVKDYPGVGNVSSHICASKPGDKLGVKGCFTKIKVEPNKWKRVGMLAGGSGITPCLQVAEELLSSADDKTEITLIFCNRSPQDIFLKDHIDALAAKSGGRFKVHYCVNEASFTDFWNGLTGFVTSDMVKKYLPPPADDSMVMVCGPPPMYKALCGGKVFEKGKPPKQGDITGVLGDLGYTNTNVFKF
mmetsp:Transcript_20200/g.42319  ORF Transcript_20200/g.42319 Transcript_20200/m.42319 type:complete len:307 (-) Transcript_20200:58-978(-)